MLSIALPRVVVEIQLVNIGYIIVPLPSAGFWAWSSSWFGINDIIKMYLPLDILSLSFLALDSVNHLYPKGFDSNNFCCHRST